MAVKASLRPLITIVRRLALTCPLTVTFRPLRGTTAAGAALRGQCVNASALFHLLAGGSASGWRMMRIGGDVWKHGPHYFVEHDSGQREAIATGCSMGAFHSANFAAPSARARSVASCATTCSRTRVLTSSKGKVRAGL